MADDDAGAVRRTPRPACDCEMFDFCDKCWGPEQQREAQIRQLAYCEEVIPSGPEDAEQCPNPREPGSIHCATHQRALLPEVMHDAGETAEEAVRRLAAEVVGLRQNQRPVVLLRAEDCACPVGGDCPHGPEPVDALNLAVWLHAEAQHRLAEEQAASYRMYARVFKALGVSITAPWSGIADAAAAVVAERDALQARLDAALAKLARYEPKPGCCTACNGVGTVPTGYPCEDCYATGHCHPETVACTGEPSAPQGDKPAEPPRRRPLLIAPDDPCQDERCSRVDGRCVGSHCGRCNQPSSSQGHYTSFCSNSSGGTKHHFCCPDDCELIAEPTGEVDRG